MMTLIELLVIAYQRRLKGWWRAWREGSDLVDNLAIVAVVVLGLGLVFQ